MCVCVLEFFRQLLHVCRASSIFYFLSSSIFCRCVSISLYSTSSLTLLFPHTCLCVLVSSVTHTTPDACVRIVKHFFCVCSQITDGKDEITRSDRQSNKRNAQVSGEQSLFHNQLLHPKSRLSAYRCQRSLGAMGVNTVTPIGWPFSERPIASQCWMARKDW